ncbi:hypothetical protein IJH23_00025 [Candidatus Saccharibacteria bacterium]|nr:hypothetical protein [Candidatus Saccharibacteria bacterium]MBQ3470095.1 hypothetical protein [Candidatus Saccharibacteria bacterium]
MLNKKYIMVLGAAVGVTTLAGASQLTPSVKADAASSSTASVTVATSCSMSGGGTYSKTINNGQSDTIGTSRFNMLCNDPSGFAVYAIGYGQDTNGTTVLHSDSLGSSHDIATNTSGSNSYWNMRASAVSGTYAPSIQNNFGSAHAVPSQYTKVAQYTSSTDATVGSSMDVTYTAYVSSTQPAGTYTGKVKYVLIHPSGSAPSDNLTMQSVDTWKDTMLAGETYKVTDTRDNKEYYVSKLDDGNIWMTQNLDLCIGCSGTTALTSENTDLNSYGSGAYASGYAVDGNSVITWTPSGSTMTGTPATVTNYVSGNQPSSVTGWTNDNYKPYMAEVGTKVLYAQNTTAYDNVSACVTAGYTQAQCEHYQVGNFYNWTAAIASNNSQPISSQYTVADNSICPKGWRLPNGLTNPSGTVVQSDFNAMLTQAGIAGGTDLAGSTNVGYASGGFNKMTSLPYAFSRFGHVNDTTMYYVGGSAYWWSSTASSGTNGYYLYMYGSELYPAYSYSRLYGFSVRCVAR